MYSIKKQGKVLDCKNILGEEENISLGKSEQWVRYLDIKAVGIHGNFYGIKRWYKMWRQHEEKLKRLKVQEGYKLRILENSQGAESKFW